MSTFDVSIFISILNLVKVSLIPKIVPKLGLISILRSFFTPYEIMYDFERVVRQKAARSRPSWLAVSFKTGSVPEGGQTGLVRVRILSGLFF